MISRTHAKSSLLLAGFVVALSAMNLPGSEIAPAHFLSASRPEITVEGRSATTPAGGVRLGFPGVTLHLRYHGSALTMRLKSTSDEAFFDLIVDQGSPALLRTQAGEHDYAILQKPAPADHVIEIARRTESWQGVCEVIGFDLGPDGFLLPPPSSPSRKLLFIGDSITCGANADYRADEPPANRTTHNAQWCNAQATFCKILARRLHAQCHLVSYGGRGVTRDWQGFTTVCNAPQFYKLALPDDPSALWDPGRYVPDAVGICLGANDFNQGIPDEQIFVNTYVDLVRAVRRDAPNAWIFLLDCPILKDAPGKLPTRTVLHAYLEQTAAKLNDPRILLAPVSYVPGNPMDHHPTSADHQAIAAELEPIFRKALTGHDR